MCVFYIHHGLPCSSIWSLWRHFDLSEVIFTYIYIALSFHKNNIVLCSSYLCETLYCFNSASTSFSSIPRPYPSHIDLNTPCSTVFLQLFIDLARILSILLRSRLIFWYKHWTLYTDPYTHLHTISNCFLARYQLLWCWCGCFLTIQHSWMHHQGQWWLYWADFEYVYKLLLKQMWI